MAVEARHLNLFSPQPLRNREIMNAIDGNANMYGVPIGLPPLSGTTTETLLPVYGSGITDSFPVKPHNTVKAESGLTYNLPVSRKRNRDSIDPLISYQNAQNHQNHLNRSSFTFLGEDISLQIQHQQLEIDNFIAQHTQKVRLEIEQRRRNSRRIIAAVEEKIVKRLRAKEEEIDKIEKLNWALEEKVKSLCMENQIWRDLAQTNEATANALRSNLEQVLAHVQNHGAEETDAAVLMDDAQSCCGSNDGGGERRTAAEDGRMEGDYCQGTTRNDNEATTSSRLCRNCGKVESCVLLLPCRHLCLCTVCGSSLHTCPICKSTKNASVHVNMSS